MHKELILKAIHQNEKFTDDYYEAANKICLYFIAFCSTTFAFIAASILHNQDVVFNYRWLILALMLFLCVTVFLSLQTLHRNIYTPSWCRRLAHCITHPLSRFNDLSNNIADLEKEDVLQIWDNRFLLCKLMFGLTIICFLALLFSLLFNEPTKQKITEQPTTTATQAKTSYHIQVIPRNCGEPLIPSLIYC